MRRMIAIGDIHGCLGKLEDLFRVIEPGADDRIVFLGDYVDRGDEVFETVEFLVDCASRYDCVFLRGNHEDMFLQYLEFGGNERVFFANGGLRTIESYVGPDGPASREQVQRSMPESHRRFYANLEWFHEEGGYLFVHAGLRPGVSLKDQDRRDLVWIRDEFIARPTGLPLKVVFGNTPFSRPLVKPDKIGIDTGAVYGGPLTAVVLPEEKFLQSER